ncbi:MAG: polyprenyl synthetase family protein [Alistipes sp.]|nr:polyprenyl synthetase family protein [Alistipes sp.]
MVTLDAIRKPVAEALEQLDATIAQAFVSRIAPAAEMVDYGLSSKGKRIRAVLALLAASLETPGAAVGQRALTAAMCVEMIHAASLIHDDVIDESSKRRGRMSLNALLGSHNAVVAGDYILARTISAGLERGHSDIVAHTAAAIATLCEGEILQSLHARRSDTSRADYLEIIGLKTASLMAVSASAGSLAAEAPQQRVEAMHRYGYALGMAFQIKDDILDYTACDATTGKPSHNDLREGKITLPLIAVLENSAQQRQSQLLELLCRCRDDSEAVAALSGEVIRSGGIAAAETAMQSYADAARAELEGLPDSPARSALLDLCTYTGQRER